MKYRIQIVLAILAFLVEQKLNAIPCQELLLRGEPAFFPEDVLKPATIKYTTYGEFRPDKPVIVLLHGLGGSKKTWRKVAPILQKDFFVITPDTRGHGNTSYDGDKFSTS